MYGNAQFIIRENEQICLKLEQEYSWDALCHHYYSYWLDYEDKNNNPRIGIQWILTEHLGDQGDDFVHMSHIQNQMQDKLVRLDESSQQLCLEANDNPTSLGETLLYIMKSYTYLDTNVDKVGGAYARAVQNVSNTFFWENKSCTFDVLWWEGVWYSNA